MCGFKGDTTYLLGGLEGLNIVSFEMIYAVRQPRNSAASSQRPALGFIAKFVLIVVAYSYQLSENRF